MLTSRCKTLAEYTFPIVSQPCPFRCLCLLLLQTMKAESFVWIQKSGHAEAVMKLAIVVPAGCSVHGVPVAKHVTKASWVLAVELAARSSSANSRADCRESYVRTPTSPAASCHDVGVRSWYLRILSSGPTELSIRCAHGFGQEHCTTSIHLLVSPLSFPWRSAQS